MSFWCEVYIWETSRYGSLILSAERLSSGHLKYLTLTKITQGCIGPSLFWLYDLIFLIWCFKTDFKNMVGPFCWRKDVFTNQASQFKKIKCIFISLSHCSRRKPERKRIVWAFSQNTQSVSSYLPRLCFQVCPGRVVHLKIKNSVGAWLWNLKKEPVAKHSALLPIKTAIKHKADVLRGCRHWWEAEQAKVNQLFLLKCPHLHNSARYATEREWGSDPNSSGAGSSLQLGERRSLAVAHLH